MDNLKARLVNCFQTVFSELPESDILNASQTTVAGWDSVAAITLVNVIEEEFQIEMDYDVLADLNSFDRVHEFLAKQAVTGAR